MIGVVSNAGYSPLIRLLKPNIAYCNAEVTCWGWRESLKNCQSPVEPVTVVLQNNTILYISISLTSNIRFNSDETVVSLIVILIYLLLLLTP